MQKKRKIIISIVISLGLALAATQISSDGGLQSAVLDASPTLCKNGTVTSLERCTRPLTTEKALLEKKKIEVVGQIPQKKKECEQFERDKNTTWLNICLKQLAGLSTLQAKIENDIRLVNDALSKLVSEKPLFAQREVLKKEIEKLSVQIDAKNAECVKMRSYAPASTITACEKQLASLKEVRLKHTYALKENTALLKKVAGTTETELPPLLSAPPSPVVNCCSDPGAANYDYTCGNTPGKTPTQFVCSYPPPILYGCTDVTATNYNAMATNTDGSCTYLVCGDARTEGGEQCDDGNTQNGDGCSNTCQAEVGGCMDQNATNYDINAQHDNTTCTYPQCGNSSIESSHNRTTVEQCDDGNTQSGDGCSDTCQIEIGGCTDSTAINYNPDAQHDDGSCLYSTYGCTDSMATNYDPNATSDDGTCETKTYFCPDEDALNYEEDDGSDPNREPDEKVCEYCGPTESLTDIQNGEGKKVKTRIGKMSQEQKDACKKEICALSSVVEVSSCTIATDFKPQYAYLQMYLELVGKSPGTLNGIYRSSKDITSTPQADSATRKALVSYATNKNTLNTLRDECPLVRDIIKKELIKDYKTENTDRIKVAQMALTLHGMYSGNIDGDRQKTYDLLKKFYKWSDKKFGAVYIAGSSWKVGRATRFGYQDSQDNGRGSPFVDPAGKGILTNNTTLRGASLPLPVTVGVLCPNIVSEIKNYLKTLKTTDTNHRLCNHMIQSSDPMNPTKTTVGGRTYGGLAVLSVCIWAADDAGYTSCRKKHHKTQVSVSSMGKSVSVPLVDIGPSEFVWNNHKEATIDLTTGAMKALSDSNGMLYETCFDIIAPEPDPLKPINT